MPRYRVGHSYSSRCDGVTYGPWAQGEEVELDVTAAAWVNRDSPGTLTASDEPDPPKRQGTRGRR